MLQIITGNFFKSKDCYIHDGKGVLYSNALYNVPIKTSIGILEPMAESGDIATYVFSYKNQIEKGGIIIRTGDSEIIEQFKLICSFGLQSYFSEYREQVIKICRPSNLYKSNYFPQSSIIPDFVNYKKNLEEYEVEKFRSLISKILELDRFSYKKILSALKNLSDSIDVLEYNIDIAYSILVYCLESLAQSFVAYRASWKDWDQSTRNELEKIFLELDKDKTESIKNILIKDKQFKLQQRFIGFVCANLNDIYFQNKNLNLRKSHLIRVLKNAYLMRSQFVHTLKPIQDQLRHPFIAIGHVFNYSGEPYLTYQGLLDITMHVIENVINVVQPIENEDFNWKNDLLGIVQLELNPSYWIGNTKGFDGKNANKRLIALFSQIESGEAITSLDNLMDQIMNILPNSKKETVKPMILFYWLYNGILPESRRCKDWSKFLEENSKYITEISIENIAIRIILGVQIEFELQEIINEP